MKGIFQIIRHTMANWGILVAWCILTLFSGAAGEKVNSPGVSVMLVALFTDHFVWTQPNWERTLRLLPVDPKRLILGRYLLNALGGLSSAMAFGLGLLLGGHSRFLVELPMILGCTLLIGAVKLPLQYKFTETNLQKTGVMIAGYFTAIICMRLMRRKYILEPIEENSSFLRIQPVSLKMALILLALGIAAAVISYFITCKLDEGREW